MSTKSELSLKACRKTRRLRTQTEINNKLTLARHWRTPCKTKDFWHRGAFGVCKRRKSYVVRTTSTQNQA